MATKTPTKPAADLAYLCRALKAPSMAAAVDRLAQRARDESWTHEEFLAACLEREVAARQDHGGGESKSSPAAGLMDRPKQGRPPSAWLKCRRLRLLAQQLNC